MSFQLLVKELPAAGHICGEDVHTKHKDDITIGSY